MRKRVNFQILKRCQQKIQSKREQTNLQSNPIQTKIKSTLVETKQTNSLQSQLYKQSYQLINDLLSDIKRPFKNICIHGYHPHQVINYLINHYNINTQTKADTNTGTKKSGNQIENSHKNNNQSSLKTVKPKLTIIDYLDLVDSPSSIQSYLKYPQIENKNVFDNFEVQVKKVQTSDDFLIEEEQFDLIISALELNHCNNQEKLLEKYLRTLKPDGALIGCAMVEGTLSQLHWSYLMAQNQRHGGLSPKVLPFPSLGQLGNLLTQSHYHLATVLNRDYHLQLQSPLQVIKLIQLLGQSMHLKGRRKGVYKELLVAMYAMYQNEFQFGGKTVTEMLKAQQQSDFSREIQRTRQKIQNFNEESVLATLVLSPFVGWKYSPDQPKPLRRGQKGDSIDFVDQLRKHDPDLQHFIINEQSEQPQSIKSKLLTQKMKQKVNEPSQSQKESDPKK